MTPEQIRKLLRDRPSVNSPASPRGWSATHARSPTRSPKAPHPGTEATPEDLRFLAQTGADPQAIAEYFSQKKDLVAKYPGLPYGLQSADYQSMAGELPGRHQPVLGPGHTLGAPQRARQGAARASLSSGGRSPIASRTELASSLETFRGATARCRQLQLRQQRTTPRPPRTGCGRAAGLLADADRTDDAGRGSLAEAARGRRRSLRARRLAVK